MLTTAKREVVVIVDRIENIGNYKGVLSGLDKAFGVLETEDFAAKAEGRYEVDGDNVYYMVQRYQTAPIADGKIEAHKKYIDIQFVVSGEEFLGYVPTEGLIEQTPHDEQKDFVLYEPTDKLTGVKLYAGMFSVLWPSDGHMPGRQIDGQSDVCKVVFKVKI